jgi:membrane fusion protein
LSAGNHSLFRKEALQHRADRLHGDVSLAVPIAWQLVGYLLLAALAIALIFLATASYSRVETVGGAIVLDRGVASIVPSRPGIVTDVLVRDGQRVRRGETLARIRSEEDMTAGGTTPQRILEALGEQDHRLSSQAELVRTAASAERGRLAAQISGLGEEIVSLDAQIGSQRRLVEVAENEFSATGRVAARGFISRRDLDSRETALLARCFSSARL